MPDKMAEALAGGLKQALAEPTEQRLFRGGNLAGLFPGRGGVNGEAAAQALREGLLEIVRTETKGKTTIEWVRITPRGVQYLHEHESPLRVLAELREALRINQEAIPLWLEDLRQRLQALEQGIRADSQRWLQRLDALSQRVEEALRRLDAVGPELPDGVAKAVPWALDALTYLDRRCQGGAASACPLPELFAALAPQYTELSVTAFHDGLRQLQDRRAVRLLPFAAPAGALPEPEFALFDGTIVYYFAAR